MTWVLMVHDADGVAAYGAFDGPVEALSWATFRMPLPMLTPTVNGTDEYWQFTDRVPVDPESDAVWDVVRVTPRTAVEIGG